MSITGFGKSSDPRNPVNVVGMGVVFDLPVWLRAAVGRSVRELFRKIRSDLDRSVLFMTGACLLHRIYVGEQRLRRRCRGHKLRALKIKPHCRRRRRCDRRNSSVPPRRRPAARRAVPSRCLRCRVRNGCRRKKQFALYSRTYAPRVRPIPTRLDPRALYAAQETAERRDRIGPGAECE